MSWVGFTTMRNPMTFEELTQNCTPEEREALVFHLASIRYRNTIRALLKCPGDIVNPHVQSNAEIPGLDFSEIRNLLGT